MNTLPRLLAVLAAAASSLLGSEPASISVQANQPGAHINPSMWGVFFEDINFGADGGLYAELVKNGSFEFPDARMGWKKLGGKAADNEVLYLRRTDATEANGRLVRIHSLPGSSIGLSNEGFRGIGVQAGETYEFTVDARCTQGATRLRVELLGTPGVLASGVIEKIGGDWSKLSLNLVPNATEAKATLNIIAEGDGFTELDRASLFPRKTWKNRPQGLRADMVQMLADMKPGFLRFPGGCIVEGFNLDLRYQWKKTLLPREERQVLLNRWNVEMKDRQTPDYFQSFGLGFFEYFQLCEDIGAQPLPIINCGMACQFNSTELVPLESLAPYVQDALDLIEFANGPVTSTWGAKRAALGHPAPFGLKLLGIGNEQWGPQYVERYQVFAKAIRAAYPDVKLVVAAGPSPADARFNYLWDQWKQLKPDIVDEHSYSPASWFINSFRRYDSYSRQGSKVFVGEYACHTPERKNNLESALAEAVFMLGLERNADVVSMAAYAPLFAHVDAWQWKPDMIWVDNLRVMGTPNYYVQKLFSLNRGDLVVPTTVKCGGESRLFASASRDEAAHELILKVVNPDALAVSATLAIDSVTASGLTVKRIVLSAASSEAENSLDDPRKVSPVETTEVFSSTQVFAPCSFTLLRIPLK
jgi:alpha-L-arabinofuranosidase